MALIRAFIAIELSDQVQRLLDDVAGRLRRGPGGGAARWVRSEGTHLTLKFLGDTPDAALPSIEQALMRACAGIARFEARIGGLGCFPNPRRPRVVWIGVRSGERELSHLQAMIEQEVAPLGFPPETRGFTPHLTLARIRRDASLLDAQALGNEVMSTAMPAEASLAVDHVSLIRSDLRPSGAIYSVLARVPLASSGER